MYESQVERVSMSGDWLLDYANTSQMFHPGRYKVKFRRGWKTHTQTETESSFMKSSCSAKVQSKSDRKQDRFRFISIYNATAGEYPPPANGFGHTPIQRKRENAPLTCWGWGVEIKNSHRRFGFRTGPRCGEIPRPRPRSCWFPAVLVRADGATVRRSPLAVGAAGRVICSAPHCFEQLPLTSPHGYDTTPTSPSDHGRHAPRTHYLFIYFSISSYCFQSLLGHFNVGLFFPLPKLKF